MSGLDSLPPDQRAVLQLILVQGRGYADLAETLRLEPAAVRERAHAGAAALVGERDEVVDAATRSRVVDYLLGQQDDGERIVTFAQLGESASACRWAQDLRARLAPIAGEELPDVPAAATTVAVAANGRGAAPAPAPDPVVTADPAADPALPDPSAATAAFAAIPPVPPAPPPAASRPARGDEPSGARPSRLGGAILIAGAAALAIVLAIVLIGGNGDDGGSAATNGAQTQARSTPQTQTQASATAGSAQARPVGAAVLRSPTGDSGLGAALVQQSGGRRLLAVEAARLPGNAGAQFYAIWLQGPAGDRFLGFVPRQVRANGTFTVSSALPGGLDLSAYTTVLVTVEDGNATASPTTPGATVLSGPLRLAG